MKTINEKLIVLKKIAEKFNQADIRWVVGASLLLYLKGYVDTLFGRRRPVPELSSSNFMQRAFGERVAMNSPIQGTAADIMKIAMIGVNNRLKEKQMKSRLVLQVHDELLIEAYKDEVEDVKQILAYEMEHAANLLVPLDVDMHVGDNWYEAK